jgi:hypothetical protein
VTGNPRAAPERAAVPPSVGAIGGRADMPIYAEQHKSASLTSAASGGMTSWWRRSPWPCRAWPTRAAPVAAARHRKMTAAASASATRQPQRPAPSRPSPCRARHRPMASAAIGGARHGWALHGVTRSDLRAPRGGGLNAGTCRGRTMLKCLRSTVATSVRFRRSAIAITDASTMPRGRLTYCSTSSAMRAGCRLLRPRQCGSRCRRTTGGRRPRHVARRGTGAGSRSHPGPATGRGAALQRLAAV